MLNLSPSAIPALYINLRPMLCPSAIPALYINLRPSVVSISTYNPQDNLYYCEVGGVIIDKKGYVLTVSHFLEEKDETPLLKIECFDAHAYTNVRVVKKKAKWGLVMLKIEEDVDLRHALLSENELEIGQHIYSIGHSFYMDFTFMIGQVAHPFRRYRDMKKIEGFGKEGEEDMVDHSARYIRRTDDFKHLTKLSNKLPFVQFNNIHGDSLGGSSGSPVFDREGKMVALYLFEANGITFGIHGDIIKSFVDKVMKNENVSSS